MSTFTDGREALGIFRTYFQNILDSEYADTFSSYGGAEVILEDDEPGEPERMGKPFIVLSIERDTDSADVKQEDARDVTARFDVCANEFNGARTGGSNPVGSDTQLSKVLSSVIKTNYRELRDMGFTRIRIDTQREQIQQAAGEAPTHLNPHRIVFTYYTP